MTTPTLTHGEKVATELKSRSHWRLLIEPLRYRQVFETPEAARNAVRAAVVRVGAEDFPVIDSYRDSAGNSPIDGGWEGWSHYGRAEAWRAMCSGQFVAVSGLEEDNSRYEEGHNTTHLIVATRNVLEFVGFARRFTKVLGSDGVASVRLSLRNVGGRTLTTSLPALMRQRYTTNSRDIELMEHTFPSERSETPFAVERDLLTELFGRFGWNPPVQVLDDLIRQTNAQRL